jgi:hypothetical protein
MGERDEGRVDLVTPVGEEIDTRIARLAARQHGVVTTAQLRAFEVGRNAIARRVRRGRLHRVHRGVYAVGHPGLAAEGRWAAAVLASGKGAALSHASAAVLWRLLLPVRGPIDVSVPTADGRIGPGGVRLHRCRSLAAAGLVTQHRGIQVTTPARTVADLPGVVPPRLVRRARRQAELFGLLRLDPRGARTRSDLEDAFLRFCRDHGVPAPEANVKIGRWTVDFVWRRQRLAVETDDLAYHRGDVSFEDDHALELDVRLAGYEFRRFTGGQLRASPERVARDLRKAIGRLESPA